MPLHPTAIVHPGAEVDATADVGAYAVVEAGVCIGAGTRLWPHAYVACGTSLGERCQIHPFAVVGHAPQDLKYDGSPSYTTIGDDTIVREHASIHRGTEPGSTTVVGRRCYIMSTAHVGHNCVIGDDVKLANSALLSGHCRVDDGAFLSGNVSVHQFVRIGELTMLGGGSSVARDVPPFMMFVRTHGLIGLNLVGLRRAAMSARDRAELHECYKILFRSGLLFPAAVERVARIVRGDPGRRLLEFLRAPTRRGYDHYRGSAARPPFAGHEADS